MTITLKTEGDIQLKGTIRVPGDKSISHRAVMLGAIAKGKTKVYGLLTGDDCLNTIECFRKMGVVIRRDEDYVEIDGTGFDGLQEPVEILDVGNSGTTIRLMLGILAGAPFHTCLIGDASIAKRPMDRVALPLRQMGAKIDGRADGSFAPISIRGGGLEGIDYVSPVASAQVKSAILLAGLHAEGVTTVIEPQSSRNHTERMLRAFGCQIEVDGLKTAIKGKQDLHGTTIHVPGDISSAAFFLAAGVIVPNSELKIQNVGINPTRTGIIDVLKEMGANIIEETASDEIEPAADITIKSSNLKGIEIGGDIIPRLIDEIPIIALAATQAEGKTIIKDAAELKVKETNRIDTVVQELTKMGAKIEPTDDGMIIYGGTKLRPALVDSHGDHRIGMMLAIASCLAEGETFIENSEAISISYPNFFQHLKELKS
ncbi:3-phosphoshikimate 1-carboxyvinyltransferase [Siminovitchia terrae]|uniref:3-phosphoshikimate 1-carboxyvinyltransferase n=1 Tax=Siminovitchia terrae TaxID=1914933 RepID=A0A429X4E8_SIMTE|nr:3-phosphoshikimate 1-carboxyvinyltransferase [Siminovitchia terrae]RST58265.1 3-phosphoshikimate 1-carboxyvinyltransferase [Siminovitchia terrae]